MTDENLIRLDSDKFQGFALSMMNPALTDEHKLYSYVFGLNGEAGELANLLDKKWLSKPVERDKVANEAGDVLHYAAGVSALLDLDFPSRVVAAVRALKKGAKVVDNPLRYPNYLCHSVAVFTDTLKKQCFQGHPENKEALWTLLGSILFGLLQITADDELDVTGLIESNVEKLITRYPNGFTPADSMARRDAEGIDRRDAARGELVPRVPCSAPPTQGHPVVSEADSAGESVAGAFVVGM
jgi:NTP pyrophosphatase (non-canonical NTP hydrolase)